MEEVVIEVLVQLKQEMHEELLRTDHLLGSNNDLSAVSVVMTRLHYAAGIPGWEEKVRVMHDALPLAHLDNLFCFVVDIVDRSYLDFSFFVPKGMEN